MFKSFNFIVLLFSTFDLIILASLLYSACAHSTSVTHSCNTHPVSLSSSLTLSAYGTCMLQLTTYYHHFKSKPALLNFLFYGDF